MYESGEDFSDIMFILSSTKTNNYNLMGRIETGDRHTQF
jgi:hypothetical protein